MATVPRHLFVDSALASRAYEDSAMPIATGRQSRDRISSPAARNFCSKRYRNRIQRTVLEIGTGCGYAAAVLAQLFGTVVSVERCVRCTNWHARTFRPLRLPNLRLVFGDGSLGISGQPPFDGIVAAAAGRSCAGLAGTVAQ